MSEKLFVPRNGKTIREASEITGLSPRTIRRWTSIPRAEWLQQQRERRESIRSYHDDEGHPWSEVAKHFGIDRQTAQRLGYKARKERAAEREAEETKKHEALEPTLF